MRRTCIVGILCAVISGGLVTTAAGNARPAWVVPETLNVRSGPGTDRRLIGQLNRGAKVHVTATESNWCWARLPNGEWGWIAQWLLEFSVDRGRQLAAQAGGGSGNPSSGSSAWIRPDTVNVRSGPGTNHERRGQLNRGASVSIIRSEQGWSYCRTPGGHGWIRSDLLERDASAGQRLAQGSSNPGGNPSSMSRQKGHVSASDVRLRSGPGTDQSVRGMLARGATVFALERRGDWLRVDVHGGQDGWVHSSLVKFEDGGPTSTASSGTSGSTSKGFITGSRVHLRAGPSLSERIRAHVVQGQTVYVTQRQGDWYRVRVHGGNDGWIHTSLVRMAGEGEPAPARPAAQEQSGSTARGYVAGSRVRLRAGPGTTESIRATVVEGQTVYVTGRQGDWLSVTVHGGASGWIHGDLVRFEGEEPARPPAAETPAPATPAPTAEPSPRTVGRQVEDLTAWIGEDTVNVRYGPGTDHEIKMRLSRGTQVDVQELTGHWCKIADDQGNSGWVAGWVMNFKGPGQDPTVIDGDQEIRVRTAWVARPTVNVRSGPGTGYESIGQTVLGTEVIILDREDDWYRVVLDNGKTGYMASWLLDTRAQRRARLEDETPPASSLGQAIIATARRYLGSRYVRGGTTPAGFDCSGFVQYVLRQHGIRVSRTSRTQFRDGTPVSRDQLQPGDVVFFRDTYRAGISHVGIFIGGDEFIHAGNRRTGVNITTLSSAYYSRRYAGARRMR